jgi:phosphomannomutase
MSLPTLLVLGQDAILGHALYDACGPQLPLLPKTLGVGQLLSVQAHPPGFTESYIVLEAEPDATLCLGFAKDVDPQQFAETLRRGLALQKKLLQLLVEDIDQLALQATLSRAFSRRGNELGAASSSLASLLRDPKDLSELKEALNSLESAYWEVLNLLNEIPVAPGDILHNANPLRLTRKDGKRTAQVHALGSARGKEILILEIRLPAPTFRAWDHVRFPMREIALDDAVATLDFAQTRPDEFRVQRRSRDGQTPEGQAHVMRSIEDPAFVVDHLLPPAEGLEQQTDGRAHTLHCIAGAATLCSSRGDVLAELGRGESALIPAGLSRYRVHPKESDASEVVRVSFPDSALELARSRRETQIAQLLGSPRAQKSTPLRFGTSGLRARVVEMTDREVYINTRGFLDYLKQHDELAIGELVAIGQDLRAIDPQSGLSSSPRIAKAVVTAVLDSGATPFYGGPLPTPALAYYALDKMPAIMVTGSHIPADRNGIKFYKKSGEVLKTDESGILSAVRSARARQLELTAEEDRFDESDMLRRPPEMPPVQSAALDAYLERYLALFRKNDGELAQPFGESAGSGPKKRIVLYQHSAVGRDFLVTLFETLGASVLPVMRSEKFVSVDTEDVTAEDRALYRDLAHQHRPFAIISTDGDSDRPLLIDEKGAFHRGDVLGVVTAEAVGARFAAVPISTSDALDRYLEPRSEPMIVQKTRIGSPHVIAAMQQAVADGHQGVVGWEANGGFLTANDCLVNGKPLSALPTRDAVLPILATLLAACKRQVAVSTLFAELPQRATGAGLIDNFPPAASQAIIAALSVGDAQIESVSFDVDGPRVKRFGAQPSELADPEHAKQFLSQRERIGRFFSPQLGFGQAQSINYVDGVRIFFSGGEIAHLRPSGNAPQLRIYVVSDSDARTQQIVDAAIAEPDGLLRRMQRELASRV